MPKHRVARGTSRSCGLRSDQGEHCRLLRHHAGSCDFARRETLSRVRAELAPLGLSIRLTETGAYRINHFGGSERSAYYSEDLKDVLARGRVMGAGLTDLAMAKLKRLAKNKE